MVILAMARNRWGAEPVSRRQKKTILLLGSGASAASTFKLPTMTGFFASGLTEEPKLESFLKLFYSGRPPQSYNLEEILGYLDLAQARLQLWGYGQKADEGKSLYDDLLRRPLCRDVTG